MYVCKNKVTDDKILTSGDAEKNCYVRRKFVEHW